MKFAVIALSSGAVLDIVLGSSVTVSNDGAVFSIHDKGAIVAMIPTSNNFPVMVREARAEDAVVTPPTREELVAAVMQQIMAQAKVAGMPGNASGQYQVGQEKKSASKPTAPASHD